MSIVFNLRLTCTYAETPPLKNPTPALAPGGLPGENFNLSQMYIPMAYLPNKIGTHQTQSVREGFPFLKPRLSIAFWAQLLP